MKNIAPLFSSNSTDWLTPPDLFNEIKEAFGIQYDPCADKDNPLPVIRYSTIEDNGLLEDWKFNTFINPPYSSIGVWVEKAIEQSNKHPQKFYVMLLPSRTDRPWFRRLMAESIAICFVAKRLKFSNSKNNAPFPSLIAIICKAYNLNPEQLEMLQKHGYVMRNG